MPHTCCLLDDWKTTFPSQTCHIYPAEAAGNAPLITGSMVNRQLKLPLCTCGKEIRVVGVISRMSTMDRVELDAGILI